MIYNLCFGALVHFGRNTRFDRARFSGEYADFYKTHFDGYAFFNDVQFSETAWFWEAQFGDFSSFWCAKFRGDAWFRNALFNEDASFEGTRFSSKASFEGAEFSEYVHFQDSRFDHANLTLEDAKIYVIRLSDATFENKSKISLNRTDYERLYVHWDLIEDALVYNGEAYLTLVKNFRNIEYFEDADNCYYHYRRERQSMRGWQEMAKYTDILGWITCGYGVRPGYTLGWGFALISFFGIVFWAGNGIHRRTMPSQNNINKKAEKEWHFSYMFCIIFNKIYNILRRILATPKILRKVLSAFLKIRPSTLRRIPGRIWKASFVTEISFKDALYFSTMVFVSQPPHDWRPKDSWKWKVAVMLEDVLGWLLLALFLVTLGNVMIR